MNCIRRREFRLPSPYIILPGSKAPYFTGYAAMPDGSVSVLSLKDKRFKDKVLVLMFYVGDWTTVCRTELSAFSIRAPDFAKCDSEILFCSTDSHFTHLAFLNKSLEDGGVGRLNFPLLDDRSQIVVKAYGVTKPEEGLAFRATFIIDKSLKIRQIAINDLPTGRDVDDVLRTVKAVQYCDKTGLLCPANWVPNLEEDPDVEKARKDLERVVIDPVPGSAFDRHPISKSRMTKQLDLTTKVIKKS